VAERIPRLRRAALPPDIAILVRGDTGEPYQDRLDALAFRRRFPDWLGFGVSGFYAMTEAEVLDLAGDRLSRFASLRLYDPDRLVNEGLQLLPTFRTPHVTIGFADLGSGLSFLGRAVLERRPNPYHSE